MLRDDVPNEKIITALDASYGIITDAAKKLGVSRRTLHYWIDADIELQEAAKNAREGLIDLTEGVLIKNLKAGKEATSIFVAKTLGRHRGYVERHEYAEHNEQPLFKEDGDDKPPFDEDEERQYDEDAV